MFNVTLEKGDNWIGIIAINEGTNPPASVAVKVNDGVTEQEFDIDGEVNKPWWLYTKIINSKKMPLEFSSVVLFIFVSEAERLRF